MTHMTVMCQLCRSEWLHVFGEVAWDLISCTNIGNIPLKVTLDLTVHSFWEYPYWEHPLKGHTKFQLCTHFRNISLNVTLDSNRAFTLGTSLAGTSHLLLIILGIYLTRNIPLTIHSYWEHLRLETFPLYPFIARTFPSKSISQPSQSGYSKMTYIGLCLTFLLSLAWEAYDTLGGISPAQVIIPHPTWMGFINWAVL